MSVLTLPVAKTHLNIPASNTSNDGELVGFIEAAEAEIAVGKQCGPLEPTTVTVTVPGRTDALMLTTLPIISLTSVTAVGGSAVNVASLLARPSGEVVFTAGGWFAARWYTVVYQAGRTSVEANLLLAVKEQLRYLWQTQLGNSPSAGAAPGQPSGAESVAGLPSLIKQLIRPYVQTGT